MDDETINLGVAGRATSHFITLARIPITRLEPMDGQRTLIQANFDAIYAGITEENAPMRDINPLCVILPRGDAMEDVKRHLSEQRLDRMLSFDGIPEEYKLQIYSGFHRFTAATRYIAEHQSDPQPPTAAMRSWLCGVYDAEVADDADLAVLVVAHNTEIARSPASTRDWIESIQFSGDDKDRIKNAIGMTAHGPMVSALCTVRLGTIWNTLVQYGTAEFNKTLSLSIIASWGAYCSEFEILDLLLADAIRQQEKLSNMKKDRTRATPFDIFGQVWGEAGHKQSGDKDNVKRDWERAKIRAFGTMDTTYTFTVFWRNATIDENGKEYVFGKVILVPEDLRGDPKGGKRKDMPGYVILTRARVALSALSTVLFAGDLELRTLRTSLVTPDPWVSTIMVRAGVDQSHSEQFIRDLVPRLGDLVAEAQTKRDLPHQTASELFMRKGLTADTLRQMVWTEVKMVRFYNAWAKFIDHCEEVYGFERNQELWDTITSMVQGKTSPRKSALQKASEATARDKKPQGKPTGKNGGSKRQPSPEAISSDSDDEVVFPVKKRRAGKQSTSKGNPLREMSRHSDRLAGKKPQVPIEEEEQQQQQEEEQEQELKQDEKKEEEKKEDADDDDEKDDKNEEDEDEDNDDGGDDDDDKAEQELSRGRRQRGNGGSSMDEDKPDNATNEDEDSPMRNAQEDEDQVQDVSMEDGNRYDEPAMDSYEYNPGDDTLAVTTALLEDPIATGENTDEASDEMADRPRGYSAVGNIATTLTSPSLAMVAFQSSSSHPIAFPTSVLCSDAGIQTTSPAVSSALPTTPTLPSLHTVSAGETSTLSTPRPTTMTPRTIMPTDRAVTDSTRAMGEDIMVLDDPHGAENDPMVLDILRTGNHIMCQVARRESTGNGQRALDLLRALQITLESGP